MPTIIDELIVRLKLDDTEFKAKSQSTKKGATKTAKDLQLSGRKASEFFSGMRNEAIKLFGVLGSSKALIDFSKDAIKSSAGLSRMAANLGTSARDLKIWGNAVEVSGGSAEGFQSTVKNLSRSMTEFKLTGTTGILPYLRMLKVEIADAITGELLPFDKILKNIGRGLRENTTNRADAANIASMMGIDEGTFNLLIQSEEAFNKLIETEKKHAAGMDGFGASSEKLRQSIVGLQQTWEAASVSILTKLVPALQSGTNALQESTDSGVIDAFGKGWRFLTAEITGDSKEIAVAAEDLRKSLEKILTFDFSPSGWFSGISDWIKGRKEAIAGAIGMRLEPSSTGGVSQALQSSAGTSVSGKYSPAMLEAQIMAESSGNPKAIGYSKKGVPSFGLLQFEAATAKDLGIDPMDPVQAREGGTRYMEQLIRKFGDTRKALAAYNWGQGNLSNRLQDMKKNPGNYKSQNWFDNIPKGTQDYINKIEKRAANISVGHVTINTQATDSKGIAKDFVSDVVSQADSGMR